MTAFRKEWRCHVHFMAHDMSLCPHKLARGVTDAGVYAVMMLTVFMPDLCALLQVVLLQAAVLRRPLCTVLGWSSL